MTATATVGGVLHAVRELAPSIREHAAEFEAERQMPVDLFDELRAAGVWRFLTPRSHGGLEAGLLPSIELLETLAIADGSTAWTTMIGFETPQLLALLPRHSFDELYADGPDVTVGGAIIPAGEAVVEDGGYRITGRWPFASGCQRWDLLMGTCIVYDDGQPRVGPTGQPAPRAMVLPAEAFTIEDTWRTLGMRATGSHHLTIDDAFVPEDRTLDFFFGRPSVEGVSRFPIIDFHFHIATCALGIARAAIDEVVDAAQTRQRMGMRTRLAQTPLAQNRLGSCDVALRAARTFLLAEAERAAASMAGGSEDFLTLAVRVWANHAWIAQVCEDVVDTCFSVHGASGVYDGSRLQRCLRDIHTMHQHASLNENSITRAGAALLGEPVDMTLG
jgi:alkylation response protein AidB-like acyl-CoA dehydrogenase